MAVATVLVLATSGSVAGLGTPGQAAGSSPAGSQDPRVEAVSAFHNLRSIAGPGAPGEATDINDRGAVVGVTSLPGTATSHAFLSDPRVRGGQLTDLTPSESRHSRAQAVNRFGIVAGTLGVGIAPPGSDGSQPRLEPFIWRPRTGLDVLPLPPGAGGAQAVDINDRGTVLVVGTNASGVGLPVGSYLWDPTSRTYTTLPPATTSAAGPVALAHMLDERGGVVGGLVTQVGAQAWQHAAVVWEPGTLAVRELASGGAPDSYATDRNERGLVVGWRITTPGGSTTAVYWPAADAEPVPLPGRVAFQVNDAGQIAGIRNFTGSSGFPFSGVIWEPGKGRTTGLGDNNLGSYVLAINGSGRSAGYAVAAGPSSNHNTAGWWDAPRRGR